MPAVRLPGLLSTFSKAFLSQSSRQIKWYKSPNLCSGCIWAFRAKLSCVLRISSIHLQNVPLDCSIGFAHASLSPIFAALRLTCTVAGVVCDGLSPSPTTMAAPTPFHHFNHSLSSPCAGRVVGSPTFATKPFTPKFRFLLYARPMSPDIVVIARWLIPHEPLSVCPM